jgi:tetratricopeptide (TPR) repeat protein
VRVALVALSIACSSAFADPPKPDVAPVLDRIAKGDKTAFAELTKVATQPGAVDELATFLARKHAVELADRRKVLEAIKAQVPDKNGRFTAPERKSAKEEKADDDLDWLASLTALPPDTVGLGEVVADDAAIRALAKTNDVHAAAVLFTTAFGDDTIIYRDELGRYLRKMEPYSIPSLIVESQDKNYDKKRYANYQLERLDRQEPQKALSAANGDEALTIAVLEAFEQTHYREAVHAVWTKVDADSVRVRAAARKAWMAYITGPAPPPAPKKKLSLPGGKLTKKEKPLWLTYRELADNEIRKALNELLHEDLPLEDPTLDDRDEEHQHKSKTVKIDLVEKTNELFKFYDDARAKREGEAWAAAKGLADKGDVAGATTALDRMLAMNPEGGNKAAIADIYFKWGKQLEQKAQYADAAAAYSKAAGVDPKGPHATDALAAHHYMQGKALEAKGLDGGPDFRRAVALRPDYSSAKAAAAHAEGGAKPTWMLYAAGTALLAALGLFAAAMVRRRA